VVEYLPTVNETLVCLGIWAFGLMLYTIFVRITIPVLSGELLIDKVYHTNSTAGAASSTESTAPSISI